MRRHAIIITAYKNFTYLEYMAKWLCKDFDLYIHIDKKSTVIGEKEKKILEREGCVVVSKYNICWGGINHLYSVIDLLSYACKKEYEYYHVISGEDLIVRSYKEISAMFEGNNKIYISCHDAVNNPTWNERYRYKYIFTNQDYRKTPYRQLNKLSIALQKKLGINYNRIGLETDICKGYLYGSLPHDAVLYVLGYIKDNYNFMRALKKCYIPEELFFQTILYNSPMKERIAYNCLRYSVWEYKNGSIPGYLDEEDFEKINKSDYIFARKVNFDVSKRLIELAKEYYDEY